MLGVTSIVSHVYLELLNSTRVYNLSTMYEGIFLRGEKRGLLTVCNHISTVDDPSIFATFLPLSFFFTESSHRRNRWTMCAKEMCFKNRILSDYFQNGKVLPIERGKGLDQPTIAAMAEKLDSGDWVHIFPEGKISTTGRMREGRMKWGAAKILCDGSEGKPAPVVIPYYHLGLQNVMPLGTMIPRVGHKNTVVVGDPVDLKALLDECRGKTAGMKAEQKERVYTSIMQRIEQSLRDLEGECQRLHGEREGAK